MSCYTKLSLLTLAAFSTVAIASKRVENDALAIAAAKIPLTQAVTLAEQHASGKATRAEFENSRFGKFYDIEIVSGSKVFDVRIDAEKGTVISSTEDKEDREEDDRDEDKS